MSHDRIRFLRIKSEVLRNEFASILSRMQLFLASIYREDPSQTSLKPGGLLARRRTTYRKKNPKISSRLVHDPIRSRRKRERERSLRRCGTKQRERRRGWPPLHGSHGEQNPTTNGTQREGSERRSEESSGRTGVREAQGDSKERNKEKRPALFKFSEQSAVAVTAKPVSRSCSCSGSLRRHSILPRISPLQSSV